MSSTPAHHDPRLLQRHRQWRFDGAVRALDALCGPFASGLAPAPWPTGPWLHGPGPADARAALAAEDTALQHAAVALLDGRPTDAAANAAAAVGCVLLGDITQARARLAMGAAATAARLHSERELARRCRLRAVGPPVPARRPAGLEQLLGAMLDAAATAAEAGCSIDEQNRRARAVVERFCDAFDTGTLTAPQLTDLADYGWLELPDPAGAVRDACETVLAERRAAEPTDHSTVLVTVSAAPLVKLAALAAAAHPFSVNRHERSISLLVPAWAAPSLCAHDPGASAAAHPPVLRAPLAR